MPTRMRGTIPTIGLILRRRAVLDGIFRGHRGWRAVAVVVFGARFLRRALGRNPQLLTIDRLLPGQTMVVRAIAPTSRRGRRRAARRA